MKNPKELAKLIITAFLTPTACFIGVVGASKSDGSQVVLGVAIVTALGYMWGFPTKENPPEKGGSHAA